MLFNSIVVEVVIFLSIVSFKWFSFCYFVLESLWCSSLRIIISCYQYHALSLLIHLAGELCHLSKFFPSYQVLPLFSTEVLPKLFISHDLSISFQLEWSRILSCSSCHSSYLIATSKVPVVFLVNITTRVFPTPFLSIVFLLSNFSTFQYHWFHSFVKEATKFYLFPFLSHSKISGLDLFLVEESCNSPRPIFCIITILFALCYFCVASFHHSITSWNFQLK